MADIFHRVLRKKRLRASDGPRFQKGDVVRLTGKFLRNTGQIAGGEGRKRWRVVGQQGEFVLVNEPADLAWYTEQELADDPSLRWRRIHAGNLRRVGDVDPGP